MENEELQKEKSQDNCVVKAGDFFQKHFDELFEAIGAEVGFFSDDSNRACGERNKQYILDEFEKYKEVNYNEFIEVFNQKYGNIIKEYRERKKIKMLKTIKLSAILIIISFFMSILLSLCML